HRHGLQAGKILLNGKADDPNDPKYRVYKINKDWQSLVSGSVKDAFQKDYEEWPWQDGAPWIDKDNDGIYTPYTDQPDFIGDEVLWYVANDLDTSRSTYTYGSLPLGLEQQCTVWGFNRNNSTLGNMVFKRYRMINKGIYDIDSLKFGIWTDIDLGTADDDVMGCDTTIEMAYGYNGSNTDGNYGSPPPAIGYVFLNELEISSFVMYIGASASFDDPRQGVYKGTLELFNYLYGKLWNGNLIIDPLTQLPERIMLAGDPVTGSGWYELAGWPGGPDPDDRRFLSSTGPFYLARNDTIDITFAIVIDRGEDNIDSITRIRRLAGIAKKVSRDDFSFPQVPQPQLHAVPGNQQI
ncbi:MAG: hypothetical protein KDF60_20405, partial [Calditrichaeota bacterium]|nr:hypothetical protein [Calditrichota bacterium]